MIKDWRKIIQKQDSRRKGSIRRRIQEKEDSKEENSGRN